MLSNKPYLLRAFYDWIVDSDCTPFLAVNANSPRCQVPQEYVENGEITLNIDPEAIRDLKISNTKVEFKASFSGVVHIISAPMSAVLGVYAQENGQGMFFEPEEDEDSDGTETELRPDKIHNDISPSSELVSAQASLHQDQPRPSYLKVIK